MKVCFFSPTAYSYFRPDRTAWAGGAETQQLLLANHMKAKGIDVSFIVGDFGQDEVENVNDITLIKSFTPFKGNRKLRFIPDMIRIRNAMRIAARMFITSARRRFSPGNSRASLPISARRSPSPSAPNITAILTVWARSDGR